MNILFDNLKPLIDAPNGIEKARELILQLAVQGKLVTQDPNDEPASELLKKIKLRKNEFSLYKDKINHNDIKNINEGSNTFELPVNWVWARIIDIMVVVNGRAFKPTEWSKNGLPIIRIQNLNDLTKPFNYCDFEVPEKYYVKDGDLLIGWSGTPGTSFGAFIWDRGEAVLNQHIFNTIFLPDLLNKFYLRICINTRIGELIKGSIGGVGLKHFRKGDFEKLPIQLPPLAEQKRIVEKVNSLMALLDELEEKRERRNQKRIKLNNASLEKLLTSKDNKELKTNWKRIEENFSTLYSVPENVEKLKQAILQLAVQSKLVEQDPNDEPASELLKKIKKEKEKLIAEGKIKKQTELPPIKDEEKPFELPKGWEWVRLGDLSNRVSDGFHHTPTKLNAGIKYISATHIYNGRIDWNSNIYVSNEEFITLYNKAAQGFGDILIVNRGAGCGDAAIVNTKEKFCFQNAAIISFSLELLDQEYILNVLLYSKKIFLEKYIQGGAQPLLSNKSLLTHTVPIAPLNEQKRIVEKVNELLSLCNELEEKLTKKEATAEKLVGAVVKSIKIRI